MVIDTAHLNLHQLRVLCTVVRLGSFSRAAEELFISQPAVSKYVRRIEEELHADLFTLVGGRVRLTEAGRIVYDFARRMLELGEDARQALRELEGVERGCVRVAASYTPGVYLLPSLVAHFRARYATVDVALEISNSQRVLEAMREGLVDLGFVGWPAATLPAPGLQLQPYLQDELALITPPHHPLAGRETVAPELLEGEAFVLREPGSATRSLMEERLTSLGLTMRASLQLPGSEAVKRAVMAGLGLSFVSVHAITLEVQQGVIAVCPDPSLRVARPISIVARKDARSSAAALAFASLARRLAPALEDRARSGGDPRHS